jgi:uncharacterized membrane protein
MSERAPDTTKSSFLPPDNAAVLAHVALLQAIIARLAGDSASCKTWCLAVVAALLSLAAATHVSGVVTFALVPVVLFGFIDTMYLAEEKAYRDLYAAIVGRIRSGQYALAEVFEARAPISICGFLSALGSWSILPVYLGLIAMYVVASYEGWLKVLTAPAK